MGYSCFLETVIVNWNSWNSWNTCLSSGRHADICKNTFSSGEGVDYGDEIKSRCF